MCQGEQQKLHQRSPDGSNRKQLSPSSRSTSVSSSSTSLNDNDNNNETDTTGLLNKQDARELAEEWEPIVTEIVNSAPPPWHSVAFIGSVAAIMVNLVPSGEELDQVATLQTFARAEPWIGGTWNLAIIRGIIALSIWATTLHVLCGPGWTQITNWKPGSKLKPNTRITLKGIKTMFPFTSFSWNLLGISYTLNALIAYCVATGNDEWIVNMRNNALLRAALMIWETAAPCAILVSTVIRYAIWEMVLKGTGDTSNLKAFRNIMMHNMNSVFVLAEVALFGGLPVRFSEVSLSPLFGATYVVFTWSMQHQWAEKEHGPQFIYYFFDTTMGKATTISLIALLCVLLLFYVLFATARVGLDELSLWFGEEQRHIQLAGHFVFTSLLSSAVCRFRD